MNNPEYYLAIDQGGHASRAIVFDQAANIISQAECPIHTYTPQPDRVEHKPQEMIDSVRQAIDQAVTQLGNDKQWLKAAGLASQRSSIICWDKFNGQPLSPILSWQDRRQQAWMERFREEAGAIHNISGLFPSPHYGASKLRWCLDNLTEVQQAQQQQRLVMGPMASFLLFHLAQQRPLLVDPANASRTLLWNLEQRDWDDSLCQTFGVHKSLLPRCVDSRFDFGSLTNHGMEIPITVMTGDQPAALFAMGKPQTDTIFINMGTGVFIQQPQTSALKQPPLLTGIAIADGPNCLYTLEGTVNGAGQALHWFEQEYGIRALERQLPDWLVKITTPPLFINGVAGVGSPYWQARLDSQFIETQASSIEAKAVAVVESIAFLIQANLELFSENRPKPLKIILSGGLSRLDGLCRRIATLSGLVTYRGDLHEATALGLFELIHRDRSSNSTNTQIIAGTHDSALLGRYQRWKAQMEQRCN